VKALLVDLDDTLLDYSGGVEECWLDACSALAGSARVGPEDLAAAIGRARRWFWSDVDRHRRERTNMLGAWSKITARALSDLGAPDEALAAAIAGEFAERRWKRMALFAGVPEALDRLRQRGLPLALVTNGDRTHQRRKIEQHDLARFFDVILIEGEFGAGKPDLSVYRHVLDALGVQAADAWMIGDNIEWDVAAPQRLGLKGVWVDASGQGVPEAAPDRPHAVVRAFAEILTLSSLGPDRVTALPGAASTGTTRPFLRSEADPSSRQSRSGGS
jgi:putative hydrolase of the HAD superfamily